LQTDICIIIPIYNAAPYLPKLLESLKNQTIDFKLVLVDSSSTDDSVLIAKTFIKDIIVIKKSEFDHGGTRTKIAKMFEHDILLFMTQDILLFSQTSIENIVKPFEDISVAISYGRQIPCKQSGPFGAFLRQFNYPEYSNERTYADKNSYGLRAAFVSNSFCAYKRSYLEEVNFFEDKLIMSEDMYAAANLLRKGYKVYYAAEAKVYHSHDYSVVEEFRRYFDIGVFHGCKPELQKEFGSAAGEGKRFVKEELQYLINTNNCHLLPLSLIRNGAKLIAYKLGKQYKRIPSFIRPYLSMHSSWWQHSTDS